MTFKGKKVVVMGLARSGVGAANLLHILGAGVTVTDKKKEKNLKEFSGRLSPGIKTVLGGHPDGIFEGIDLIVISPGIPTDIEPLIKARDKGIKIIGELELAYLIAGARKMEFLAITGTNGKSTTTTLLDRMVRKGGFSTIFGGNIGHALTEELLKDMGSHRLTASSQRLDTDYVVAEISSFQLETIYEFRAKAAAILNITPDHLDRYSSLKEYGAVKANIFLNQTEEDFLVLNADDPETIGTAEEGLRKKHRKPGVFYFSRQREVTGVYFRSGKVYCNMPGLSALDRRFSFISADEIRIKGVHNLENAMAASAMAFLAGCPVDAVRDSLMEFPGLEHRLELVRELDGVRYINDSKGTNVGAVIKSLESITSPIVLIAGGRDKAGNFSLLSPFVKERVKALVLIGEAGMKISKALKGLTEIVFAKDLQDAVRKCRKISSEGDVVMLSPACASFDMFLDFEDRGRQFKEMVMKL